MRGPATLTASAPLCSHHPSIPAFLLPGDALHLRALTSPPASEFDRSYDSPEWHPMVLGLRLAHVTQRDVLKIHPSRGACQNVLPFLRPNIPLAPLCSFIHPSRTLGSFPPFNCCGKRGCDRVSFLSV